MKSNKHATEHCHQISIFDEPIINQTAEEPPPPVSQNHILCRKNVFYCEKNCSKFNNSTRKFDNVCEVTGEQWESEVWSPYKDYEKEPIITPCKACEHVKCEWCAFNSKNTEPYGCCGSCAYKEKCPESKWAKANSNR
jgi:hypothetical protein